MKINTLTNSSLVGIILLTLFNQVYCQEPNVNQLKVGDYLNVRFIDNLKKYKFLGSAYDASGSVYRATVDRQNNGDPVIWLGSAIEGLAKLIFNKNGEHDNEPNIKIEVLDRTSFLLNYDGDEYKMKWVGDCNVYITSILLVGSYHDKNGRLYTFTSNTAKFPDTTLFHDTIFNFEKVDYDGLREYNHIRQIDSICDIIAFRVQNNILELFRIPFGGDIDFDFQGEPTVSLKKIADK